MRPALAAALLAACSSAPRADAGPEVDAPQETDAGARLAPGVSGAPLDGRLELDLVDDITLEAVDVPITIGFSDGTMLEASTGVIEDARLVAPISITVAAPGRPQRWDGVGGSRVVFGVARPSFRTISGRTDGETGAAEIRIRTFGPARLVRTEQFDRGDSFPCSPSDCTFDLVAPRTASGAAAVLYASGEPIGAAFARGDGPLAIDVTAPTVAADVPLPPPPAGLGAVVGVPGISIDGHVALLGYTQVGHFVAPEIAAGSYWILARAEDARGAESVVMQRSLASLDAAGAWGPWLDPPSVTVGSDGAANLAPTTSLVAIDWLDGTGQPTASALLIAPAGALTVAPPPVPVVPRRVRVRALDVPGVSGATFDLAAVDRTIVRYAQTELAVAP
jgi:hypothetical protein